MKLLNALLLLLFIATVPAPAFAEPYRYSPEGCEFEVTFPDEPYESRRCNPDNPGQCTDAVSYTKVFQLDASINFTLTCHPVDGDMYDRYTGDVMKATLAGMVADNRLDTYETAFGDIEGVAKRAVLLGSGTSGASPKVYTAQLWIGKTSVFTVEGELVGEKYDPADELFADILQSIHVNSDKVPQTDSRKDTEKKADSKGK